MFTGARGKVVVVAQRKQAGRWRLARQELGQTERTLETVTRGCSAMDRCIEHVLLGFIQEPAGSPIRRPEDRQQPSAGFAWIGELGSSTSETSAGPSLESIWSGHARPGLIQRSRKAWQSLRVTGLLQESCSQGKRDRKLWKCRASRQPCRKSERHGMWRYVVDKKRERTSWTAACKPWMVGDGIEEDPTTTPVTATVIGTTGTTKGPPPHLQGWVRLPFKVDPLKRAR